MRSNSSSVSSAFDSKLGLLFFSVKIERPFQSLHIPDSMNPVD